MPPSPGAISSRLPSSAARAAPPPASPSLSPVLSLSRTTTPSARNTCTAPALWSSPPASPPGVCTTARGRSQRCSTALSPPRGAVPSCAPPNSPSDASHHEPVRRCTPRHRQAAAAPSAPSTDDGSHGGGAVHRPTTCRGGRRGQRVDHGAARTGRCGRGGSPLAAGWPRPRPSRLRGARYAQARPVRHNGPQTQHRISQTG